MILYDSVKLVLILPLSQILMKGQSLAFKKKEAVCLFCCIKLANLGEGGIDFLDIPELVGWHAYFQILTT